MMRRTRALKDAGEVRVERSCERSQRPLDAAESPSLKMHPPHSLGQKDFRCGGSFTVNFRRALGSAWPGTPASHR